MTTDMPLALGIEPPYYAVIFSSKRSKREQDYDAMASKMLELASQQQGYLGSESVRGSDGFGITISYWSTHDSISAWKLNVEHAEAQIRGKREWYEHYHVRIAKVERDYGWHHRMKPAE